jgi:hypothetical protein
MPVQQPGLFIKDDANAQDRAEFLPLSEIDVDVKITDSISYIKLK